MDEDAQTILNNLRAVDALRGQRDADAALKARTDAVKSHQHRRFQATYADLLASPRYGDATRFFLNDLYGPGDFSERDRQFARVVPALVRLFPPALVFTVRRVSELHVLTEQLDTAMAQVIGGAPIDDAAYARAWRDVGRGEDRLRQIDLTREVGACLDRYVATPWLRHSMRLMRGPARAAGLQSLQTFLETGMDAFRKMKGADAFLAAVVERERSFVQQMDT